MSIYHQSSMISSLPLSHSTVIYLLMKLLAVNASPVGIRSILHPKNRLCSPN